MVGEPGDDALFEFFWRGADGAAVVGMGDFPEYCIWVVGVNFLRVADRNVAVDLAVDQKDGDLRSCDGLFRRNLLQMEVVFPAGAEECGFDQRTENDSSEPRSEMERLAHAVEGDFVKVGERGFGYYGAEGRAGIERLQKLRGAHGFSEAEDAAGVGFGGTSAVWRLRIQEVEPLVDVIALEQAVSGERAVAGAVGAGVWHEDVVAVSEQELGIAGHADAVVAETVEEDDGISIGLARMDEPGAEGDGVGSGDGYGGEIGVEGVGGIGHRRFFFLCERSASGVQNSVGEPNAGDGAEGKIQQ